MVEDHVGAEPAPGGFRIDFAQISQDRFDRSVQAVKIKPVKARLPICVALLVVMLTQPADEIEHIGVAPHPLRESFETAQRVHAVEIGTFASNETIDAVSVRPIGFHRDGVEAALINQPLGDEGAFSVKFVRPVTRFAEAKSGNGEGEAGLAHHLDERVVVVRRTGQRVRGDTDAIR